MEITWWFPMFLPMENGHPWKLSILPNAADFLPLRFIQGNTQILIVFSIIFHSSYIFPLKVWWEFLMISMKIMIFLMFSQYNWHFPVMKILFFPCFPCVPNFFPIKQLGFPYDYPLLNPQDLSKFSKSLSSTTAKASAWRVTKMAGLCTSYMWVIYNNVYITYIIIYIIYIYMMIYDIIYIYIYDMYKLYIYDIICMS